MRPAFLRAGCGLALVLTAACASDLSGPFSAVTISYDPQAQKFHLAQVRVATLTSLRHLTGSSGQVRAGGSVQVKELAVLDRAATVQSLRTQSILESPGEVEISWSVLNDIAYPENYSSLELLTAYYNVERARASFLGDWGLATGLLPAAPLIAHARIAGDDGKTSPLPDGELYYSPLATFYLPDTSAQLPLVFNLGAVGHALGHQAVEELVWGGAPVPRPELESKSDPAWNTARHLERSLTEGLADYLGVALTNDPRWFDYSLAQTSSARALDNLRCGTSDMLLALPASEENAPYDPFPLGTVLAGALWEASQAGVQISAKGVLASLQDLGAKELAAGGQLGLAAALDVLVADADPSRQASLCGLFLDRFAKLSVTGLPSCPAKVVPPAVPCR